MAIDEKKLVTSHSHETRRKSDTLHVTTGLSSDCVPILASGKEVKLCILKIDPTFHPIRVLIAIKQVCRFSQTKLVKPVKSGSLAMYTTHREMSAVQHKHEHP